MPQIRRVPRHRKHKRSGPGGRHSHGKDLYLGPHGTRTGQDQYDRGIAEWLAAGRCLPGLVTRRA